MAVNGQICTCTCICNIRRWLFRQHHETQKGAQSQMNQMMKNGHKQTNKYFTTNKTYPKGQNQLRKKNPNENPQPKPNENPQTKRNPQTKPKGQPKKTKKQKNPGDEKTPPLKPLLQPAYARPPPPTRTFAAGDPPRPILPLSAARIPRGTENPFQARASAFLSFCASVSQDCPCAVVFVRIGSDS